MKTLPKNSNSKPLKSTQELQSMMQEVLELARDHGATDASVAVNHDCGFSIDVRMREVETVAFSEDKGVGVTVYIKQRKGSASSSDTSPQALKAMIQAACDIAKVSAEDPCFGLPDPALLDTHYPNLDLFHPWDITPQQAIEKALACEEHALSLDKRITNSDGVNFSTYTFHHGYASSQGFSGVVRSTRHSVSCALVAAEHDIMQSDYDYTTSRYFEGLLDLNTLAERAVERATSRLGARKIKTQKTPILFSSRLSSSLMGLLVSAISGGNLYRKNSFLLGALGQKIFPAWFKVHEQPHLLRALGSSPYDAEGLLTRNNVLVDQGQLCQYVLSSYTSRKLGLKTTANSGGVFNLTIEPNGGDFNDLLKKMDRGLLVTELMGDAVNILTGDYSRGAKGYWVEGGKIQYPVEEITIAGHLKSMFAGIVAVGTDINPNISTRCGSILIDEMMVAGA